MTKAESSVLAVRHELPSGLFLVMFPDRPEWDCYFIERVDYFHDTEIDFKITKEEYEALLPLGKNRKEFS